MVPLLRFIIFRRRVFPVFVLSLCVSFLNENGPRWPSVFGDAKENWRENSTHPKLQVYLVFTSLLEENLVPDECLEPKLGAKFGLRPVVATDFPLELSQQFLSFASSMGIVMQEHDSITQHSRAFASDGFTMA
ncbi:hypothetical protein AVEN_101315-1 [Araneus ventricosus]|uniref:Uncharacterized protein n=1 Tax=Araneus ventricosus TaxID=182803 RepID=A0A4Y2EIA7_ARAVE|nr:hypothetical protein AVEN_101315-1 [Araneus ventricosus]